MPLYEFYNKDTDEYFERFMTIANRELFIKDNPNIEPVVSCAAIVSGVSIRDKVPDGFKEVLSKVSESHKASAVAERHGRKSIKEIKTEQILKKHREKI